MIPFSLTRNWCRSFIHSFMLDRTRPAYLSKDGVNDGSQFPPVSLLQSRLVRVSHGGGQAQGLGLWLRRPLHAC